MTRRPALITRVCRAWRDERPASVSTAYRFYIIGDGDRVLANELGTFADDVAVRRECEALLAKTPGAKAVEAWDRARLVHRHE